MRCLLVTQLSPYLEGERRVCPDDSEALGLDKKLRGHFWGIGSPHISKAMVFYSYFTKNLIHKSNFQPPDYDTTSHCIYKPATGFIGASNTKLNPWYTHIFWIFGMYSGIARVRRSKTPTVWDRRWARRWRFNQMTCRGSTTWRLNMR